MKKLTILTLFFVSSLAFALPQCEPVDTWIANTDNLRMCIKSVFIDDNPQKAFNSNNNCKVAEEKMKPNSEALKKMDATVMQNCLNLYGRGEVGQTNQVYNMYLGMKRQFK